MTVILPSESRYKSKFIGDKLEIIIPVHRRWYLLVFLFIWLIFWLFGELAVGGMIISGLISILTGNAPPGSILAMGGGGLFMLIWLIGWTVGGGFAIYIFLWQLVGRERIVINKEGLTIARELWKWSRAKSYLKKHLLNLRVSPEVFNMNSWKGGLQFWGIGSGVVAFDYGAKTVRFGSGMEEAEGNMILSEIQQYFPEYN